MNPEPSIPGARAVIPPADLERLFDAAVALGAPAAQAAFLDQACPDPVLRREVESLLESHRHPDGLFEEPSPRPVGEVEEEVPGAVLGRYRLLEFLGEGGVGRVFAAEQTEPVRRRVALKILKPGMDSRDVIARFEAERQAMAMMDHPGIAKVLDAGTTGRGRPFVVMELVAGLPITDYCERHRSSVTARIELAIRVCRAIQHAHQKGVLHRDIKPTNLLVVDEDGTPVPRVIDFGIAKALEGRLGEHTTLSTRLHPFVGTPAYMSPEQAEMGGIDVDTRSDLYSLGVLIYELVTGSPPFDGRALWQSGLDVLRRTIRETEPPRPSQRLAALPSAELEAIARARSTHGSALLREVRGDIDWILLKCLEKDRSRRYASVDALAADLRRFLAHEPIQARPPGPVDRFRKWARRNRVASLSLLAVALGLSLGLALAVAAWVRGRTEAARTEAVTGFIHQFLSDSLPPLTQRGDSRAARELIATADRLVSSSLSNAPVAELVVRVHLWKTFIEQLGDYPAALSQSEAIARIEPQIRLAAPQVQRDLLAVFLAGTRLWASGGPGPSAEAALAELDRLAGAFLARTPAERAMAREIRATQGSWLLLAGRFAEAESRLEEACRLEPVSPKKAPKLHGCVPDYARALSLQGRFDRAERVLRERAPDAIDPDEPAGLRVRWISEMVHALCGQGRHAEAERWVVDHRRGFLERGAPQAEQLALEAEHALVMAMSGRWTEALPRMEAVATHRMAGVRNWHRAMILALSLGEATAVERLAQAGVLEYASVAEGNEALMLADGLLAVEGDATRQAVAAALVERVATARDWSRDFATLLRARLAWRQGRFQAALESLDESMAQRGFGVVRAGVEARPAYRAELRCFRAELCARLGREAEARSELEAARAALRVPMAGSATFPGRGEFWEDELRAGLALRNAEAALKGL
jgi:serine/threonine protein kinase/tetratricopeptide (TPR) repeat protein